MKIRAYSGGKFAASTLGAGAVLLLNQPAQDQMTREATVQSNMEAQRIVPSCTSFKPSSQIEIGTHSTQVFVRVDEAWDYAAKRRYKLLATKEALGEISAGEQSELESLTLLRRRKEATVEPEQVFREYRQRSLARELMCLLEKYVEFQRPTESSSRSKRA